MPAEKTVVQNVVEEQAVKAITEIQQWVGTAKNFVVEQAPLVVQEMIRWAVASDIFGICLSFLLIGLAIFGYIKCKEWFWRYWHEEFYQNPGPFFVMLGYTLWMGFWSVSLFMSIYHLVFVLAAPRLFIIEELARLAGKINGNH